jgi:hypothetical protein
MSKAKEGTKVIIELPLAFNWQKDNGRIESRR